MSSLKPMLLPVAKTAVRHSHSGISLWPRILILITGRSVSWQRTSAKIVSAIIK
jgi:hypothetical protein